MKYYLDTEFLEGTQEKRIFGLATGWQTKPTIDLISIALVAEDGREYYAVSKDFNLKEAWNRYQLRVAEYPLWQAFESNKIYWIRDFVLRPIFKHWTRGMQGISAEFTYSNMKCLIAEEGRSNADIASDIIEFTDYSVCKEFYADYCNYDWVVFCWLFGKMKDLPKGYPYYCNDTQQLLKQKLSGKIHTLSGINLSDAMELQKLDTFEQRLAWLKEKSVSYPKQVVTHHAMADARWTKKLHEYIELI